MGKESTNFCSPIVHKQTANTCLETNTCIASDDKKPPGLNEQVGSLPMSLLLLTCSHRIGEMSLRGVFRERKCFRHEFLPLMLKPKQRITQLIFIFEPKNANQAKTTWIQIVSFVSTTYRVTWQPALVALNPSKSFYNLILIIYTFCSKL